jgi:type IV pilus assembly protein PilM
MSNIVGVDVGMNTIKIVEIDKVEGRLTVQVMGETRTPQVDWLKGENRNKVMGQLVEAIKSLARDLKLKNRQAVTCLPEDEIVSRLIRLPPLKESEIMDALRYEAETFIPYPLDQVSIDYEVLEEDNSGRLTVFAIAAKNDLISYYVKLFKSAGLEMVALESPALAMRRIVGSAIGIEKGMLVLDMGEKYSDLIAISKGSVCLTLSMSVGGESITRAISINLGLDMASAEEYKKAYGMKELELEGKIKEAIVPVFSNMAEEVRKAMGLFAEDQGKAVELLVLSGGGANMPGLAEQLTKILGVEVQVFQPFLKIDTSRLSVPINIAADGCRFSIAAGLALRGLV